MKRTGPPVRRTPLAPGAPINPGKGGLARSPLVRRAPMPRTQPPCPEKPAPKRKPRPAGRTPMPAWLAAFVLERAEWMCDRCARPLSELGFSRQHRRAHGMGGRAGGELHTPANVVVLCGSATTPGGCHNRAENAERAACEREGFVIRGEVISPEVHPILRHGRDLVVPSLDGWIAATGVSSQENRS